jgi:hypothetical protein
MIPAHRVLLAMLVAPSATLLFMLGAQFFLRGHLSTATLEHKWIFLGASYALSYTVGMPIYLLARRRAWQTAFAYMGGGFLIGVTAILTCLVLLLAWDVFSGNLTNGFALLGLIPFAIAIGFLTTPIGLLFWLIERPDRSI